MPFHSHCPLATDGEIAVINLESARRRAWTRFLQMPERPGGAEQVVEAEHYVAQFLGDLEAFDRLGELECQFALVDSSFRAALISAAVTSSTHRFDEARSHLARALRLGGAPEAIERQSLTIDQATGSGLERVLELRRQLATSSRHPQDLVPLGAALADLERFEQADAVYRTAFESFDGGSPFPLAWVCFQLGMLWGELVRQPDFARAALWYRRAIAYLPGYVKARVHLAELYLTEGYSREAESLLSPALASGDPEVQWRLADVLSAQGRFEEARNQLDAARDGYERLLRKHWFAFADHAAEFYAGSGNNRKRALELARANVANRPTSRAIRQAQAIAAGMRHRGEKP